MSAVPVSAMGRSAERPPRRLLRPPSSRSRRYAGPPVSACGLRLGHALPVTLLRPLARPARTALRASSWQPVVVPAGELDEGLPGRSEPSFLSRRGPPSPGALHWRRTRRGRRTPLRHGRHRLAPPRERGSDHYAGGRKRGDNFRSYPQKARAPPGLERRRVAGGEGLHRRFVDFVRHRVCRPMRIRNGR